MVGVPNCPHCGASLDALAERCPTCSGNLRPLLRIAELPDHAFNEAVVAGRARRWDLAAERLAVTLALRPDDVDGLVLLGKVRWRQGRRDEAVAAWQEAIGLAPGHEGARVALGGVEASRPAASGARRRRRGKSTRR